jgi:uncharacterized phage protein (TIGR01671 family)
MNNKKFRVWDNIQKKFEYFDERAYQSIGILDKNMKEIYEDDVVTFNTNTKKDIGVVRYFNSYCSYVVEVEEGYDLFADISFDSLEIVGNIVEDYMYDEKGELVKRETLS